MVSHWVPSICGRFNPLQTLQYPHGAPCLTLQLRRVSDGSFRSCQLCQDFLAPQQQRRRRRQQQQQQQQHQEPAPTQQQPRENAHLGYSTIAQLVLF